MSWRPPRPPHDPLAPAPPRRPCPAGREPPPNARRSACPIPYVTCNAGHDGYVLRDVPADSCYQPPPFAPGGAHPDWSGEAGRALAHTLALRRIETSLDTTTGLQVQPTLTNATRGFFLTYINSFNEWHEGHQFEPAKDAADLTPAERAMGYHNPVDGEGRLRHLGARLRTLVSPATAA